MLPLERTAKTIFGFIKSIEKSSPKAYPYFILNTGLYNLSYGVHKLTQGLKLKGTSSRLPNENVLKTAARVFRPSENFQKFHGLFSLATGCCSLLDAFHRLGLIDICKASKLICATGSFCFFYANVTALEENIRKFEEYEWCYQNNQLSGECYVIKTQSAIFGILSNFGYIFATAFALFEAPYAITLVIGIISAFSGGLKVIYDFMANKSAISYDINACK